VVACPTLWAMGSLGAGELIVIAIVAIVVFGPKRLPELARKASQLLRQAREATQTLTDALDTEYDGVTAPLKDLKAEYDETMQTIKKMAPTTSDLSVELTDRKPKEKSAAEEPSAESRKPEADKEPEAGSLELTPDKEPDTDGETP